MSGAETDLEDAIASCRENLRVLCQNDAVDLPGGSVASDGEVGVIATQVRQPTGSSSSHCIVGHVCLM